ncbi:TFIIH/NER complex subunit [Martiniozyma asiatica (nom. inval.)]|nr:TFIIH/NER complex subunit [Martiniozyma asiatica]
MDAISDRAFYDNPQTGNKTVDETPSLLCVILDLNPLEWSSLITKSEGKVQFNSVISSVLVMMNSHLALNSSNTVRMYTGNSYSQGAQLVWPNTKIESESESASARDEEKQKDKIINRGIYRQFKFINNSILNILEDMFHSEPPNLRDIIKKDNSHIKGTITGALSMALCAINKMKTIDEHCNLKSRILVISVSGDNTLPYVSMMNNIFAAQKMKISIDVCKLGQESIFLQQASDATNGVYLDVKHPEGLVQYLSSALFIEPILRPFVVLPTHSNVDFRASCFVTNKVVNIGYVCSVCLCILSFIPEDEKCPTCHSNFDKTLMAKMKRKPKVLPLQPMKKKKSKDSSSTNSSASPSAAQTL